MDLNEYEYEMLDLLAYNCNQLTAQLKETKSTEDQEKILEQYLKRIDKEFESINEIAEGLFTFQSNTDPIIWNLCDIFIFFPISS